LDKVDIILFFGTAKKSQHGVVVSSLDSQQMNSKI